MEKCKKCGLDKLPRTYSYNLKKSCKCELKKEIMDEEKVVTKDDWKNLRVAYESDKVIELVDKLFDIKVI